MQQRIINRVESDAHYKNVLAQNQPKPANTPTDAIITAAKQIADTIKAKSSMQKQTERWRSKVSQTSATRRMSSLKRSDNMCSVELG